jgi:ribosome-associated protein
VLITLLRAPSGAPRISKSKNAIMSQEDVSETNAEAAAEPLLASEPLRLDHFLQTMGMFETGGQAKHGIQGSEVKVNGQIETRRRRKLVPNDVVEFSGKRFIVKP